MKDKAEEHANDLAMGLTSTMKKLMGADTLICMSCKATALGGGPGGDACSCPGGKQKPPADYDPKHELLAAAMAREEARKKAVKGQSAAQQGAVQAAKAKRNAEKDLSDLSNLDLGTMDLVDVAFEPGKLGMGIEKNAVASVAADGAAEKLKVKVGWVIRKVNGDDAPTNKTGIMKLAAAAMKSGQLTVTFQYPLEDGNQHCSACDKFMDASQFEGVSEERGLGVGPGKQMCYGCEEYADMF
jgi:hypothetical protein